MLDTRIQLEKPVHLRGRQPFILIQDEVTSEAPPASIILEAAQASFDNIWVKEDRLDRVLKEYPKVPIYGIWQTVLLSKIIPAGQTLAVIETGDKSGVYLSLKDGKAVSSGTYRVNRLPPGLGLIEDAFRVHELVPMERLLTPKNRALHPAELAKLRAAQQKQLLIGPTVGFLVGTVLCFGLDLYLAHRAARIKAEVDALSAQTASVESEVTNQLSMRNDIPPEKKKHAAIAFTRLAEVMKNTIEPTMAMKSLDDGVLTIDALSIGRSLSFPSTIRSVPGKKMALEFDPINEFTPGEAP